MTQTEPSTEWKPQPGKPAMTRDEKTLVTDLKFVKHFKKPLYSPSRNEDWYLDGKYLGPKGTFHYDLIEPTAAILAAHGIDADGKPVEPSVTPEAAEALCAARPPIFVDVHTFYDGGKSLEPDAPAPSTRVDARWFQLFEQVLAATMINEKNSIERCVVLARNAADLAMAEVAKREGR